MNVTSLPEYNLFIKIMAVAAAYVFLGALGLQLADVRTASSLVWPASGLAAYVAWAYRPKLLIGVFIGSFLLNAFALAKVHPLNSSLASAAVSGASSMVQAYIMGWALKQWADTSSALDSVRDYMQFAFIALGCCAITCTLAALGQAIFLGNAFSVASWFSWWVGDLLGVLVLTPSLLLLSRIKLPQYRWQSDRDFIKFSLFSLLVCGLLFWSGSPLLRLKWPLGYALIPIVAWASLRFEQRGVALAVALFSATAISATAGGIGPFAEGGNRILALQGFIAFLCLFGGVLAGATSEKRKAQEALRSSVTELIPDIIACTTREGLFTYLNPAFEKITGFSGREWLGKHWKDLVHPDDLVWLSKVTPNYVEGSEEGIFVESRTKLRSGGYVHVETKSRAYFKNGKVDYIVSVTRDVSRRKAAEGALVAASAALERSQQELEFKVRQRTAELTRVNQQLYQATREAREFAFVASHDLQEPLRTISLHLQLIEPELSTKLTANAHHSLRFVVEASKRARDLINGLLEYSRLEGMAAFGFVPTDLNRVVQNVLGDLSAVIKKTEAKIEVQYLPTIEAEATQMAQLFQNLLANALKYFIDGPPQIKIGCEEMDDGYAFSVEDKGIGIDSRHFDKVFRLFSRIDRKDMVSGTGIGLAICKKVVERHHGKIWLESKLDAGTKFMFFIPRIQPSSLDPLPRHRTGELPPHQL